MNKVLVIGAAGFTGTHFLRYLERNGLMQQYEIVFAGRTNIGAQDIPLIEIDLAVRENVDHIIRTMRPNYIVNLIGTHTEKDFDLLLKVNAGISRDLCESVVRHSTPLKKMLFIGSAAEYGRVKRLPITEDTVAMPVNLYGLTKLMQTQYTLYYFNNFGLPVNVARTFNIIGRGIPRSLSIGNFAHQVNTAKNGDTVHTGNLDTRRDFLDISDVIDAYWKILMLGKSGEVYNVCRGASFLQRDLLDQLITSSGKRLHTNVRAELVKSNDILDSYGDNSKLKNATGWTYNIDISDSLRALLDLNR